MNVFKKLLGCFALTVVLYCASFFDVFDKNIVVIFDIYKVTIPVTWCAALIVWWLFIVSTISSVISFFKRLFCSESAKVRQRSIDSLIRIIIDDDIETAERESVIPEHEDLKNLILLMIYNKQLNPKSFSNFKKHPKIIAISIATNLRKKIQNNDMTSAVDAAREIIVKYPAYAYLIQNELLTIKTYCINHDIIFDIDPYKFKYNLPVQFADTFTAIKLFEQSKNEHDLKKKKKLLHKSFDLDKANIEIIDSLVKLFQAENNDKKILDIVQSSFTFKPQRNLVEFLLKVNRNDLFEITQELLKKTPDLNKEKLWILCEIANYLSFDSKTIDLLKKLRDLGDEVSVFEFIARIGRFDILKEIYKQ